MEMIPVAIIAVVLLTGAVTLGLGTRGWNVATIVAAWLVLLASTTFLVLAGIRGQSERAWSGLVRGWESRLLEVRDAVRLDSRGGRGLEPLGDCSLESLQNCSLESLETKRQEWARSLERVNLWRGRFWTAASFTPPTLDEQNVVARAGRVIIASPEKPSILPGAELYVFDAAAPGEGGRFLGGFRVVGRENQPPNEFDLQPLGRTDALDRESWKAPRDEVVVYENLPFDRWVAFHRTDRNAEATVLPEPNKRLPDEGQPLRTALEKHTFPEALIASTSDDAVETPFPEDPDLPPPGVDWAGIEFDEAFEWAPEGSDGAPPAGPLRFAAGERVSAFPAKEIASLRRAGAAFKHAWLLPPGLYWAEVEFVEDASFEGSRDEPLEFTAGERARLPLAAAEQLEAEKKVSIKRRLHRRPLIDPATVLRGLGSVGPSGKPLGGDGGAGVINVDAIGIYRRSAEIERSRDELIAEHDTMTLAVEAAKAQVATLEKLKGSLESDLGGWTDDAGAATKLAEAAMRQLQKAAGELDRSEREIVELGVRLRRLTATLATEIDRRNAP